MQQVVMVADRQRRITYVNPYYQTFTGLEVGDIAERWFEVIHPDDLPAVQAARASGERYEIEYRLRRAVDGAYRWHFARVEPIPDVRRAAVPVANARRYAREHHVADSLQSAALPRRLPTLPGVRFDAFYLAGRTEARIGGDWYDAVVLADGRIAISVGDVAGSGLEAAVTMGNVRQMIRAAAHAYADPMLILEVVDQTLRSDTDDTLITAFVGIIDPLRSSLRYASAGHPPPPLRDAAGMLTELSGLGAPLGCRDLTPGESKTIALPPDAALVLYTDGLLEWNRDLLAGEVALRSVITEGAIFADAHPARSLVAALLPAERSRDDVAVLCAIFESAQGARRDRFHSAPSRS